MGEYNYRLASGVGAAVCLDEAGMQFTEQNHFRIQSRAYSFGGSVYVTPNEGPAFRCAQCCIPPGN